jgi:DsbE subfamily thiol:disulfide oxidoreductase
MWRAIPGILFLVIVTFLFYVTYNKTTRSAGAELISKPAPSVHTKKIANYPVIPSADIAFKHRYTLVNFFASWCAPCLAEHPFLYELSQQHNITIIGVAWRDSEKNITKMLNEHGNPYDYVGMDSMDATATRYGVKGLPESYLINPQGIVIEMHQGPLVPAVINEKIVPYLQK